MGQRAGALGGSVATTDVSDEMRLAIETHNLPIDEALLKAMPGELDLFRGRIKPGERWTRRCRTCRSPARSHRPRPVRRPPPLPRPRGAARGPGRRRRPDVQGRDRRYRPRPKTLTGTISGSASRQPRGLDVQAKFDLDKLQVGTREVTGTARRNRQGRRQPGRGGQGPHRQGLRRDRQRRRRDQAHLAGGVRRPPGRGIGGPERYGQRRPARRRQAHCRCGQALGACAVFLQAQRQA